jgi:hypothetical protein
MTRDQYTGRSEEDQEFLDQAEMPELAAGPQKDEIICPRFAAIQNYHKDNRPTSPRMTMLPIRYQQTFKTPKLPIK